MVHTLKHECDFDSTLSSLVAPVLTMSDAGSDDHFFKEVFRSLVDNRFPNAWIIN